MRNIVHTSAQLFVSDKTFNEIAVKLRLAGYDHAFDVDDKGEVAYIDMQGLRLTKHVDDEPLQSTTTPPTGMLVSEVDDGVTVRVSYADCRIFEEFLMNGWRDCDGYGFSELFPLDTRNAFMESAKTLLDVVRKAGS